MVANSGPLFMRQLLKKIDPSNAAPTTYLSAWNVGPRQSQVGEQPQVTATIMNLLSLAQMTTLAHVYFEKIDPCYGFIDRQTLFREIENRWLLPPYAPHSYDAVLCGVAALGSYFSKVHGVPVEAQLVRLARSMLDAASVSKAPDIEAVVAWVCHVIYLRFTATPSTAWIASCTGMHILEAAGINRSTHGDDTIMTEQAVCELPKMSRRAFGVAQHLNTWISYDVGLSRVNLQGPPIVQTLNDGSNYTDKLLQLLPASIDLDRIASEDEEFLRSTLLSIVIKTDLQPPLIMAQSNLLLCVLRQLSARNSLRNGDNMLDLALKFLQKALAAARQMVDDDTPWHHLANIPFQILCTLLAIDTPASLALVGDAMDTFQKVTEAYDTVTLNEAWNTARLILYLHQQRRCNDAQILNDVLSRSIRIEDAAPSVGSAETEWFNATDNEVSWFNGLLGDFPSLQNLNANNLLSNSVNQFG